jgi:hypothetical protein
LKNINKTVKVSGIIIGIVILLGIITYALTELVLEPYLEKKIKENVQKFADVEYIVNFEHMDLQTFGGDLYLRKMEIIPKNSIIKISRDSYKIVLDELSIEGMDVLDYIFNNKININKVVLPHGHLDLFSYLKEAPPEDFPDTSAVQGTVTIQEVNISSLEVEDGKLTIINVGDKGKNELVSCFVNFHMKDINFDFEESLMESFNYGSLSAVMTNLNGKSTDSLRSFSIQHAEIDDGEENYYASINNIVISTRIEKYALADVLGHEGDWIDAKIPSAKLTRWQMYPFLTGEKLKAGTILINTPEISVFRDKRAPFPEKKDTQLPYDYIKDLVFKFSIDTINITGGTITYQEHVEAMEEPGHITFNAINASIHNVTNDTATMNENGYEAYMNANCKVMDSAGLKAEFTFPLKANGTNRAKGSLGRVQLTTFNPMLAQVGYAKIESGICHSMDFDFTYDNSGSTGEMTFKYDNLEIKTISQDDGKAGSIGQKIKTFLADFVIDDENTDENLRVGKINYVRNTKKSVINYWWKSLLTGIRTSIGMSGDIKTEAE